jgi:hypothetical protein
LIIKGCHGGIVGGVDCVKEVIIFDSDTLKVESQNKTYIRLLNESRRDSLYKYFYDLLNIHQPDKNLEKDGFGCTYHDYDYTFKNDSLEMTIKPSEGNGIYYKIQDIIRLNLLSDIINWKEDIQQLDSTDFLLFKNQKITKIKKLVNKSDGLNKIVGLHLETSLNDTSITIIPVPNPHFSFKQLSPVTFIQTDQEFYDFIILPGQNIEYLNESDTLLQSILDKEILGVDFEFMPADERDTISRDIYGIKSRDKYNMKLKFEGKRYIIFETEGLGLKIY